jgi:hypothetical protein
VRVFPFRRNRLRNARNAPGRRRARRFAAASGAEEARLPGAREHPPPAETPDVPPLVEAEALAGEATKAWISPSPVFPAPATCPRSFMETASVADHPVKEITS